MGAGSESGGLSREGTGGLRLEELGAPVGTRGAGIPF